MVCNHSYRPAAAHVADERAAIRKSIQPGSQRRQNGPSSVPDLTGLFAGGLRSRSGIGANQVGKIGRAGRMGADSAVGLDETNPARNGSHSR